jgi:hypothetical protein
MKVNLSPWQWNNDITNIASQGPHVILDWSFGHPIEKDSRGRWKEHEKPIVKSVLEASALDKLEELVDLLLYEVVICIVEKKIDPLKRESNWAMCRSHNEMSLKYCGMCHFLCWSMRNKLKPHLWGFTCVPQKLHVFRPKPWPRFFHISFFFQHMNFLFFSDY